MQREIHGFMVDPGEVNNVMNALEVRENIIGDLFDLFKFEMANDGLDFLHEGAPCFPVIPVGLAALDPPYFLLPASRVPVR